MSDDLSARQLGVPAGASARRLARAALERKGDSLGLRGSVRGLRLVRQLGAPTQGPGKVGRAGGEGVAIINSATRVFDIGGSS